MKWPVWRPLLAAIALSALIRAFDIDQSISAMCYDPAHNAWPLERAEPWYGFYWYGRVPPISLGILGGLVAIFGRSVLPKSDPQRTVRLQRAGLFLALMLLIGPGLIVEVAMKSLWGRPRPIQCEEIGRAHV